MSRTQECQHEWEIEQPSVRIVGDVFHDRIRCKACSALRYGYTWAGLGLVVCNDPVPEDSEPGWNG